jgi:hypothetical protein
MSSKHNRRKRRQLTEVPMLVERIQKVEQHHDAGGDTSGKTYEEANWARLSPLFRAAHNKLRQARGLPTIPPPAVDLYVKPKAPLIKPFDPTDKEFVTATREFLGSTLMGGTAEGFTINGRLVK